jgi:putative chitinase
MAILQRGSSGADVQTLQQRLSDLGFDPNGIDGHFGPGTEAAIRAFQQAKGLQVDGKAGPDTLTALGLNDGSANTGGPTGDPQDPAADATGSASPSAPQLSLGALSGKVPANVIAQIPETAAKFGITSNLRLAHFLAQCALESVNFTATVENLNYSAQRIPQVFGKYFRGVDVAPYAHNPQKLGNRVYANRMGNGDEASGDGFNYRGRGYIQLTGKNNYSSFSKFIGEDCVADPDLVAMTYPLASAGFFFNANNIWTICDQGAGEATVTKVTRAVNGGTTGLAERLQNFKLFFGALT